MDALYPLLVAFSLVFLSELGDKTQLLVLSFSSKLKTVTILLGVALGSFLSHGIAILFGSTLGSLENLRIQNLLQFITYFSFVVIGIITLFFKSNSNSESTGVLQKISRLKINYIFIIAFTIAVGELGDKTFLASIGLGIGYPEYKLALIVGAISGMIVSDCLAIFLGKLLSKKMPTHIIDKLSGLLFLLFGIIGLILL